MLRSIKSPASHQGFLLVEILIAIALIAIIAVIGLQLVSVSQQGGELATDRDTATRLAEEGMAVLQAAALADWANISNLEVTANNATENNWNKYRAYRDQGNLLVDSEGEQTIGDYTRFFVLYPVSRDPDTNDIDAAADYDEDKNDLSTRKAVIHVRRSGQTTDLASVTEYLTRWHNRVCQQADWSATSTNSAPCDGTAYIYDTLSGVTTTNSVLRLEY